MFFRKKRDEEREVLEKLDALERTVRDMRVQNLPALEKTMEELHTQDVPTLSKTIEELRTQVGRHDMAIEDLLDEWADKDADRRQTRKLLQQQKDREEHLVDLLELYQEELWSVKRVLASKDKMLLEQMMDFEERMKSEKAFCQISFTEGEGQMVDFRLHEVVEVLKTQEKELDGRVARVYTPGCLYDGTVRKKARIAAWKYTQ